MSIDLVFIGAGAFREQIEIVRDINDVSGNYRVVAILDDNEALHGQKIDGVPVVGGLSKISDFGGVRIVMGVGNNRDRLAPMHVFEQLEQPLDRYESLIHPTAQVYRSAQLGVGVILYAGCVIGNGSSLGDFTKIIWNAVVGADNIIGKGVSICANATTCSGVKVGGYSFLASQCVVSDNVVIGPMAKIGLGAAVARDVDAGAFMLGNPARKIDIQDVPQSVLSESE